MRTLDEITTAVRRAEPVTTEELTLAICAYDVLMSKLEVENNPVQLQEYFVAGDNDPAAYIGPANDPRNAESVHWHKTMIGAEVAQNQPKENIVMPNINHADMVKTPCKSGDDIARELTGEDAHLLHMAVGISGESGELLDAVKKATIYRKDIDRENVIEELGDIEFYLEGLRQGLNITREETLEANIGKLGKRYEGFKYSDASAQARADKETSE